MGNDARGLRVLFVNYLTASFVAIITFVYVVVVCQNKSTLLECEGPNQKMSLLLHCGREEEFKINSKENSTGKQGHRSTAFTQSYFSRRDKQEGKTNKNRVISRRWQKYGSTSSQQ